MLNVILSEPQRHRSLTVYPLVTPDAAELPYTLLLDAIEAGTLQISEIGEGTVTELLAANSGEADVLILDGEQLIGAKQNRMTNRSILVAAHSGTRIPVSCMEQGRWRFVGPTFAPSGFNSPTKVRRRARDREAELVACDVEARPEALAAAQAEVWAAIREHGEKLGLHSATGALNDLQQARALDVGEWERSFPPVENQIGLLAFVADLPLGCDVIGGRALYARLHQRLLRGYITDALEAPAVETEPAAGAAQGFLDRVRSAARRESPSVGRGKYFVLTGQVIGGELRDADRVAHLSGFPVRERPTPQPRGPLDRLASPVAPPSRRRRR